jgi:hypothetical protein
LQASVGFTYSTGIVKRSGRNIPGSYNQMETARLASTEADKELLLDLGELGEFCYSSQSHFC